MKDVDGFVAAAPMANKEQERQHATLAGGLGEKVD
jgi:uncharacterized protein YbaA (DUF1428 family)